MEIGYDSATRTVLLGDQNEKHDTADKLWNRVIEGDQLLYQCDVSDAEYVALPAWHPMWDEEGWGGASVDASRSGNQWVQWKWQKDNSIIEFICCYPCQFKMGRFMSTDYAFLSSQVTINNSQAELYVDGDTSLLAWENGSGVFFWVVGTRVEAETLMDFANKIQHENENNSNLLTLPLVPEGYIRTDRTVVGNTVYEVWTKEGHSFTWLCTDNPVAVPSLESRTVSVNGEAARFWDAIESSVETPTLINGEPIKGNNVEVGYITLSAATIPGVQSNSVSTLVWGDLDNGLQFSIQGAFDSDSLIQMAEQCK